MAEGPVPNGYSWPLSNGSNFTSSVIIPDCPGSIALPPVPNFNVIDPTKYAYHRKVDADSTRCPHLLATLFMVLAVGALVDLTLPACSAEAEKYYRLGRTALSLRSVWDSPELETVQAVGLMAGYHSLCTFRYTIESAWALSGLASKLAQSVRFIHLMRHFFINMVFVAYRSVFVSDSITSQFIALIIHGPRSR